MYTSSECVNSGVHSLTHCLPLTGNEMSEGYVEKARIFKMRVTKCEHQRRRGEEVVANAFSVRLLKMAHEGVVVDHAM